jgi:hypothetical protein
MSKKPQNNADKSQSHIYLSLTSALCLGTDLLLHDACRTTIGAPGLNYRVRNGNGCGPRAIGTKTES